MIPKHYTPEQLAQRIGVAPKTVIKWFRGRPGVIDVKGPLSKRSVIRIPLSVADEWYQLRGGRPEVEEPNRPIQDRLLSGNPGSVVPLGGLDGRMSQKGLNFAKGRTRRK